MRFAALGETRENGPMKKAFIIAEIGVNHNGDPQRAMEMIGIAKRAGADAVKFQCFRAKHVAVSRTPLAGYQQRGAGESGGQREMLKKLELPNETFFALKDEADARRMEFLCTPFDKESVDLVEPLVGRFKISSGDCANYPFLDYVAAKGRPVILSTGMSSLEEVDEAVATIQRHKVALSLLHCTTSYPCDPEEANLLAMAELRNRYGVPVGYSDHTLGIEVAIAAVALGATIIEKHLTFSKRADGPDHKASLEPDEFTHMVQSIRTVNRAMGDGRKAIQPSERSNRKIAQKSVVAAQKIEAGRIINEADLTAKRPGTGIPAGKLAELVGKRARRDLGEDTLLQWDDVE